MCDKTHLFADPRRESRRRWTTKLRVALLPVVGAILLLLPGLTILFRSVQATSGTVVVGPGNQMAVGWQKLEAIFPGDTAATGTQTYVFGPPTPPLGQGSLEFKIGSNNDWSEAVGYTNLNGVGIGAASLTTLSYSTFVKQSSNAASQDFFAILVIDTNGDQTADDFLFFFPANQSGCSSQAPPQHTISQNQWQVPWDARNGVWVSAFALCNAENFCGTGNDPKTLTQYLTCFPTARIINDDGGTPLDPSDDTPGLIIGYGGSTVSANFIGNLDNVKVGVSGMTTTFDFDPCVLMCPSNITKPNDPNQCGAVVTYSPTTNGGACGTVSCSPASGSFFPVGTTTVTCKSNGGAGPEMCSFTVTVVDTQPPTVTCPSNITTTLAASCPIATNTGPINFTVTASDNCPGVTVACSPSSGSVFPVGSTTVTCTATDVAGNTATCSFTVTAFSFCLQDDSNPGNVVLVNAQTGDFSFCCGGVPVASGRGTLTTHGCIGSIDASKGDRQVHIQWDTSANSNKGAGTAYVQKLSNKTICQITDKNMSNNTCQCGNPPPMSSPTKPPKERNF